MTIHRTDDGFIQLMDQWGHGRAARHDWRFVPAVIVADDGDGHYDAWKYDGSFAAAARKIASFYSSADVNVEADPKARTVTVVKLLDGWIPADPSEPDGGYILNTRGHPLLIA